MTDNLSLKITLSPKQLALLNCELAKKKKSRLVMYLIWFFFGAIGGHRFYLGDIRYGICMLLTCGGFGIWALVDLFLIGNRLDQKIEKLEREIIQVILSKDAEPILPSNEPACQQA
ncbi:MAG: rane protein [Chlamydiales bacterium]|jgi:TM2 domain-containing membrane protein YozV|nr:rane protein [Chlamydiales bacterium]